MSTEPGVGGDPAAQPDGDPRHRIEWDGCRTEPLGSYLKGLGAWRAVVRLLDRDARAHWENGRLVLTTTVAPEALVDLLAERFEPLPVVSPWNAGSGFAGNGKNVSAERALATVRAADDPQWAELQDAVRAADEVVAEGRLRGWSGKGDELWDKPRKPQVVQLCRNLLPDSALAWLDTATVLTQDDQGAADIAYNRLLGTGGNFGRQDLSATYLQQVVALRETKGARGSRAWLAGALYGDESVPYLRDAVGQFDPGRAGGIQSSPFEKGDDTGFANPWSSLFTIEGAVLFASAVVRRQGVQHSRAALPFMVRVSSAGFASQADGEAAHAEIWTPEWSRPASLAEISYLLGEGRADWNGRPAATGLDFVRSVATLGVDRGISAFTRHVISERFGQSPLVVPVGRVRVTDRPGSVGLLADLDGWLDRVRHPTPPASVDAALRRVDGALYAVASGEPAALRAVVVEVGRLHDTVARSGALHARGFRPLVLRRAEEWWAALAPDSSELRIAGALATATDGPQARDSAVALRQLLSPLRRSASGQRSESSYRWEWSERPAPVSWGAGVVSALAEVHRLRAMPRPQSAPEEYPPAVRGVRTVSRYGLAVPLGDVVVLVTGRLDEDLIGDYLRGLLLFDWQRAKTAVLRQATPWPGSTRDLVVPPPLALLAPFFSATPLSIRLRPEDQQPTPVTLRPGPGWIAGLRAGHIEPVLVDAVRRLAAAGIGPAISPEAAARGRFDGDRLAAALLVRIPSADRVTALRRVATLPPRQPDDVRTAPRDPVHPEGALQ